MCLDKRQFNWSGLFLLSVLVVAIRGADIFSRVSINEWGLQVVHHCFSLKQEYGEPLLRPPLGSNNAAMAWLTAQEANCQQNLDEARASWREALAHTAERLTLVRSAAPYDVALAQYATERYPQQAQPFFWLGDAYVEGGDNRRALQAYEVGLTLEPDQDANVWMAVGRFYEAEGDWASAVYGYDQACHYIDQGKNGCPNAGRLYLVHEQYELAAQRYRDSMVQLPDWQPAQLGLAQALLGLGQTNEARTYLTRLANEGNTDAQALLARLSENQTQP